MAGSLVGKKSVTWTFVAPDEEAASALRVFFDSHIEFMREKSHREGEFRLHLYYISEAPEYSHDPEEFNAWFSGKYPKKTGKVVFTLNEIYDTEKGLHHHYIESEQFKESTLSLMQTYDIELRTFNQMDIKMSLWE